MGANPLERLNWILAIVALPIFAVAGFAWATVRENRSRTASIVTYIAVAATPIAWIALTRP